MDIKEFAKELSEATKDMSDEQRATVRKMFEKVADQLDAPVASTHAHVGDEPYDVPDGPTDRQVRLKENFLKQVPTITMFRARAVTELTKANPGMPKIELRAKAFRRCCETAPLVIQDDELVVGAPCGCLAPARSRPTWHGAGSATSSTPLATVPRTRSTSPRRTSSTAATCCSRSGRASPRTRSARTSTARPASGSSPASPSSPTAPTTPCPAAVTPTPATTSSS